LQVARFSRERPQLIEASIDLTPDGVEQLAHEAKDLTPSARSSPSDESEGAQLAP
jgi:hypothetical protein